MARTVLHDDERGYVIVEGNELTIGSKLNDPPKIRVCYPIYPTGGGGGAISFSRARAEGVCYGNQQDEMAMLRVEQAEDVRGDVGNLKAEFNFMVADGSGTGDVVKPLAFVWNAITRLLPGFAASLRAVVGGESSASVPHRFGTDHGRYVINFQDDTNEPVGDVYDTWDAVGQARPESEWAADPNAFLGWFRMVRKP